MHAADRAANMCIMLVSFEVSLLEVSETCVWAHSGDLVCHTYIYMCEYNLSVVKWTKEHIPGRIVEIVCLKVYKLKCEV